MVQQCCQCCSPLTHICITRYMLLSLRIHCPSSVYAITCKATVCKMTPQDKTRFCFGGYTCRNQANYIQKIFTSRVKLIEDGKITWFHIAKIKHLNRNVS